MTTYYTKDQAERIIHAMFECSFKYGMYEYFRLNTEEMLQQLVVMV